MLSILYISRNDNHGDNLLHRTQVALDGLVEYWRQYAWNIEVVFVEWNPPQHVPRLCHILTYPSDFPIRFFIVPPRIHQLIPNSDKINIYAHIGLNVAAREARGKWVLTTTPDILFSEQLVKLLAKEPFNENSFYRANRLDSGRRVFPSGTTAQRIAHCRQDIIQRNVYGGGMFTKACGDFILLARQKWYTFRGFPEWPLFPQYFDGLLMYQAHGSGMKQVVLPHPIYHMGHGEKGQEICERFPHLDYGREYKALCRLVEKTRKPMGVNDENWGLSTCRRWRVGNQVWRLEGGIPPCVQPLSHILRGIK